LRDNLELSIKNSRRIAELSVGLAEEAGRPINEQPEKNVERPGALPKHS
jgi:hypothetical protein